MAIILFYNAFNYTAFYAVVRSYFLAFDEYIELRTIGSHLGSYLPTCALDQTTTLATVLEDKYGLSTSKTGLC